MGTIYFLLSPHASHKTIFFHESAISSFVSLLTADDPLARYLAADMQLHVLGVFVLLLLRRWRGAALPLLLLLVTGSALAAGLVVYFYQLTPIVTAQTPE